MKDNIRELFLKGKEEGKGIPLHEVQELFKRLRKDLDALESELISAAVGIDTEEKGTVEEMQKFDGKYMEQLQYRLWYLGLTDSPSIQPDNPKALYPTWRVALWWKDEDSDISDELYLHDGKWHSANRTYPTLMEGVLRALENLMRYSGLERF